MKDTVCKCDCHKDGNVKHHLTVCCKLYNERYIDVKGNIDLQRVTAAFIRQNLGIPEFTKDGDSICWKIK